VEEIAGGHPGSSRSPLQLQHRRAPQPRQLHRLHPLQLLHLLPRGFDLPIEHEALSSFLQFLKLSDKAIKLHLARTAESRTRCAYAVQLQVQFLRASALLVRVAFVHGLKHRGSSLKI